MSTPMERAVTALFGDVSPQAAPDPIPLTVLVRTFNEGDRIGHCLAAARHLGGEILVVDAGSTDDTVAVAQAHGARVVHNPWPGFGPQRHFGEEHCGHDHILSLDADEIVTPVMAAEIRGLFLNGPPPRLMVVRKAIVFPHNDRPPPLGFCHEQILIYDRRVARTGPNPNWDKLEISVDERPRVIRNPLWHFTFRDWHHAVAKTNYVAKLAGETQRPRERIVLAARLWVEFPFTFLKFYFGRRYFLGGTDGLTMALVTAFGRYIRVAMMLEKLDAGNGASGKR